MITNERNIHVVGRTASGTGTGLLPWIIVEGLAPHTSLAALSHVQLDARQPAINSWRTAAGAATHREDTGNPSENRVNAHVYIFMRYVTSVGARVHPQGSGVTFDEYFKQATLAMHVLRHARAVAEEAAEGLERMTPSLAYNVECGWTLAPTEVTYLIKIYT